jgi:hypothetical protein
MMKSKDLFIIDRYQKFHQQLSKMLLQLRVIDTQLSSSSVKYNTGEEEDDMLHPSMAVSSTGSNNNELQSWDV